MKKSTTVFAALALAGLVSANAHAQSTPTRADPVSLTNNCAGGGTRAVTGSYDATTGALSTTTTLTECIVRNGDKYDGATSTVGTLLATSTGFTVDITANVNTTITRADLSRVVRVCTSTKVGTFTHANQTFDGTTAQNNCSVTGKVLEHEGLLEHLLRPAMGEEDGGGENAGRRMLPPQMGEDSIREQHDMQSGRDAGETQSGRDAGDMHSGRDAGEMRSGRDAGEMR